MVVLNFIQADQEQILRSLWLLMTRIEISLPKILKFKRHYSYHSLV